MTMIDCVLRHLSLEAEGPMIFHDDALQKEQGKRMIS